MYGKGESRSVFESGTVSSNQDCSTPGVALVATDLLGLMTCANNSTSLAHRVSLRLSCLGILEGLCGAGAVNNGGYPLWGAGAISQNGTVTDRNRCSADAQIYAAREYSSRHGAGTASARQGRPGHPSNARLNQPPSCHSQHRGASCIDRLPCQRNGLLRKREPASPKRHGRSTALLMPMRGPASTDTGFSRGSSSKGARSSRRPLKSRVMPSA